MHDGSSLWQTILDELALLHDKSTVATWFSSARFVSLENQRLTINVPNHYTQEFIHKRYQKILLQLLQQHLGPEAELEINVAQVAPLKNSGPLFDQAPAVESSPAEKPERLFSATRAQPVSSELLPNPHYTLDNFVVGNSNRVAHAAALAITESPGRAYNPLLVHGGTGVGKTHLLHAIGNELVKKSSYQRVIYFTTEKLLNDFVESIQLKKNMREFRALYRSNDAILVDDLQFLGGKQGLQEEFYHIYNQLHAAHKQIVLASDRLPKDIQNLAQRLVSRFLGGLLVDMGLPDFETRLAIIKAKAQTLDLVFGAEELNFLAENLERNVREIEGFLLKIKSAVTAQELSPTLGLIKDLFSGDTSGKPRQRLTPELILQTVTETFEVKIADLCGRKRHQRVVVPRQLAMYLLRNELGLNLVEIGEILGGRDHSTVLHATNKISQKLKEPDNTLRTNLRLIRSQLLE